MKIGIVCARCKRRIEINSGDLAFIGCHNCGGIETISSIKLKRVCNECGAEEKIKAKTPFNVYHQKELDSPKHALCRYYSDEKKEIAKEKSKTIHKKIDAPKKTFRKRKKIK